MHRDGWRTSCCNELFVSLLSIFRHLEPMPSSRGKQTLFVVTRCILDYSSTSSIRQENSADVTIASAAQARYAEPLTHAIEYTAFLNLMLASIELNELCDNYFQYLAGRLPLTGLTFAIEAEDVILGEKTSPKVTLALPCIVNKRHGSPYPKTLQYGFTRRLTVQQQTLLHELHTQFCIPLGHAVAYRHLLNQTTTDPLTGIGNRAGYEQNIQRLMSQFERHDSQFALLVIDLDNFKHVNDNFGHQHGDKALLEVASVLKRSLRDEDLAFRFGGDEFCCLLNAIEAKQVLRVAERIREGIERSELLHQHHVTASIGGAIVQMGDTIASLFERADSAVYRVKSQHKNAVLLSVD